MVPAPWAAPGGNRIPRGQGWGRVCAPDAAVSHARRFPGAPGAVEFAVEGTIPLPEG